MGWVEKMTPIVLEGYFRRLEELEWFKRKENDMGVYIRDMEKPEYCRVCHERLKCKQYDGEILHTPDDCPLIEIDLVRCKECKNSISYTMNSSLPISRWCHRFSVPVAVEDDDYCSYAERRTDE